MKIDPQMQELLEGAVQKMNNTAASQPDEREAIAANRSEELSAMGDKVATNPELLHNRKKPFYTVQQERPSHRLFIELAAKGYDVKEIAQRTGYTPVCINNILRQEALQPTLVKSISVGVKEDETVVRIIRENVIQAVQTLADISKDETKKASDRIAAAEALLSRRYGKPNQPINREKGVDLDSISIAELASQLPQTDVTKTS